jgi:hypothetical protein
MLPTRLLSGPDGFAVGTLKPVSEGSARACVCDCAGRVAEGSLRCFN